MGEPGPKGHSKPVEPQSRPRNEEAPQTQPERGKQLEPPGVENKTKRRARTRTKRGKGSGAAAKADDQKVNTEDDRAAEVLRRDADAASCGRAITNEAEHYVSPLMTHVCVSLPHWNHETDRKISHMIVGPLMLSQHQRCLLHRLGSQSRCMDESPYPWGTTMSVAFVRTPRRAGNPTICSIPIPRHEG
jgi:hypothetical protein